MNIYVLDGLNGIIEIIDTFESVIWNTQYFGQGEFQLVVAGIPRYISALQPKRYLVRDFDISGNTYRNVMVINAVKLENTAEKGWTLTITGKSLKSIVGQRVIWNQDNLSGYAETGIRRVIADNIINPTDTNRKIDNFQLDSSQGFTEEIELQAFGQNLAEWLESVCSTVGFGWDVIIIGTKYRFILYKGIDRSYNQSIVPPVVFSSQFDNLLSSVYTYDIGQFKNAALIGGEGEGTDQRTASIGTATGLDRYEAYVDGSSVSSNGEIITEETYEAMLRDYGETQISASRYTEKFEGTIDPAGLYTINTDYGLGDIVQVENEKGITASPRIIEIIYAEDENGISIVPTFSEWEV
jgi:hypothetical protein